jgi:predicted small lipoprotein YifL
MKKLIVVSMALVLAGCGGVQVHYCPPADVECWEPGSGKQG